VVEEVGGSPKKSRDETGHVGREPVVGDDAVAFAEQVAESVDVHERGGGVPGRLYGAGEPHAGVGEVVLP
jgi:hypothetical protein